MFLRDLCVKCLLGTAAFVLCAANLNADVMFTDGFDEYAPAPGVPVDLGSPWTQQGGATVKVFNWPSGSASSPNLLGYNSSGPNALASRPTGTVATDTNVTLSSYFNGELNSSTAFLVLGPHAAPGTNLWRGSDNVGSLCLEWTSGYGVELYYVGNDGAWDYYDYGGVAKLTGKVDFRFVAPKASGAQTIVVDWKLASDSAWTNIASIPAESEFSAAYIGLGLGSVGAAWADDVHFQSTAVPEPSVMVLMTACVFGLLAYAWRKQK
jgi:hypothetical protein